MAHYTVKQLDNIGAQVVKQQCSASWWRYAGWLVTSVVQWVWLDKDMVRGMQWELHASATASTRDMLAGCLWLPAGGRDLRDMRSL